MGCRRSIGEDDCGNRLCTEEEVGASGRCVGSHFGQAVRGDVADSVLAELFETAQSISEQ